MAAARPRNKKREPVQPPLTEVGQQTQLARPLLMSSCWIAGLLGCVLLGFTPHYEENDDAVMSLIVAGRVFSDRPDEHLVFSNVLLGLALRKLYSMAPEIPWYGLYLFGVTALALLGLCYALLAANPSRRQALLTAGLLVGAGMPSLLWLQFTRAAALAALAGYLLLLVTAAGRASRLGWVCGVLLLLLACLVRFDSCLLVLVVLVPVLVAALLSRTTSGRTRGVLAGCLVGALAAGWGLGCFNRWYYERDPGWRGFYEYNTLRASFTDYHCIGFSPATRPALQAAGWSFVDLAMLYNFSFADPARFSAKRMQAALKAAPEAESLGRSWQGLGELLGGDDNLLALLGFGAVCLALLGGGWRARVVPLLCLLTAMLVCVLLYFRFHLPPRVYFSAFAAALAVPLLRTEEGVTRGRWQQGLLLLAAGLLLWRMGVNGRVSSRQREVHEQGVALMASFEPHPDHLFVLWGGAFPYQDLIYPLERCSLPHEFKAVGLGWITPTPLTAQRLQDFGITDLYRALYAHRGVFLVCLEDDLTLLGRYLARHYGVVLAGRPLFSHPALGECGIYTLWSAPHPPGRPPVRSDASKPVPGEPASQTAKGRS